MLKLALAILFGPYHRPQPTRPCPTLADMDPPLVVRLADLRRARP
jgi:hypothetical protein